MKVLVTGGGGFIGAWIVRRLAEAGLTPVVFDLRDDRSKIVEIGGEALGAALEWHAGDIADSDAVTRAGEGCEAVVHLAGLLTPACRADPVLGARVNLIGMLNAFLAARTHGMKSVVYMSSAGVFGPDGSEEPRPTTLYGAFKLASEHSARAFFEDDGIGSIGFRPFVVYGPGRDGGLSAGPSLACRAAARGEAYTIPFTGRFDIIHADDVAAVFVQAVKADPEAAHVVNLVGRQADTDDVIAAIEKAAPGARIDAAGPPMPIQSPARDETLERMFPQWSVRSLERGVAETIAFYKNASA